MNGIGSRYRRWRRLTVTACAGAGALLLAPGPARAAEDKALLQPATASSVERPRNGGACNAPGSCLPGFANDGSTTTRWSSEYNDDEYWQVDLGRARLVDTVSLTWEPAYASRYEITTSLDGSTFTLAAEATLALSVAERATLQVTRRYPHTTTFPVRSARFVRVTGTERASRYGLSIWDASVFGPPDTAPAGPAPAGGSPAAPPGSRFDTQQDGGGDDADDDRRLRPLRPDPIVRIKGVLTRRGARIDLFSVRAPRAARVRVRCRGRACPSRIPARRGELQRFPELHRELPAGVVIEALVTQRGTYGRYTRLKIRRGSAPKRVTRCLPVGARRPIRCPG